MSDLNQHELEISVLKKAHHDASPTLESFKSNDSKIHCYTGLPNWEFFSLYDFVHQDLCQRSSLSPFQQLLMVLMRLRKNLQFDDLAYRFGIHKSTISRLFNQLIEILYVKLKFLIVWPDCDALLLTMPMCFRKYSPNCAIVIDCFEIFIEKPSDLMASAQTYSSYKHHNTVKYLIGITPQGTVSFISKGWGGRVSDRYITENSGLLNHLLPGDTILADRGFDIQESVAAWSVKVSTPAFTKGKKQLTGTDKAYR